MRRLIVNADDFGMTPGVSAGILAAHRRGIVTSTTAMVTMPIDAKSAAAARDSGLGIGLHVNFTLGTPLTRGRSLVDGTGRFIRDPRRAAARARAREVEAEVEAQVARFVRIFSRMPTHLDTHHHVGLFAPVRAVLLATAQRIGVPVRSENALARSEAITRGLRTPDHFFGGSGPDPYWSPTRTLRHLRDLPSGVSEFMTHPGWFDDALAGSRYARQRETEMVGLGTASTRAAVGALGIVLCDFRAL